MRVSLQRPYSPGFWGAWTLRAACTQPGKAEDRMWFPERGHNEVLWITRARRVCGTCSVRAQCLDYVLRMDAGAGSQGRTLGIWAGTTQRERTAVMHLPLEEQYSILTDGASTQIARAFRAGERATEGAK